jgi:hypothetical protein
MKITEAEYLELIDVNLASTAIRTLLNFFLPLPAALQ